MQEFGCNNGTFYRTFTSRTFGHFTGPGRTDNAVIVGRALRAAGKRWRRSTWRSLRRWSQAVPTRWCCAGYTDPDGPHGWRQADRTPIRSDFRSCDGQPDEHHIWYCGPIWRRCNQAYTHCDDNRPVIIIQNGQLLIIHVAFGACSIFWWNWHGWNTIKTLMILAAEIVINVYGKA